MAARKRARTTTRTEVIKVSQPRAAAPIIRVSAPRAPAKRTRRRRRSSSMFGGGSTGNLGKTVGGVAIGGAILGWIIKNYGAKLPAIPVLGATGAVAVGAWLANKNNIAPQITRDICISAAAVAGYQLGNTGKVSGDVEGDIVPQVGIAAQI